MPPKDPTNAQISSRLSYTQNTPSFLLKLQNRVAGIPDEPEPDDEYGDGEFYDDGSGRPPIPQRPAIPERPEDDPGSADEDDGDEKPQVVVLREGKHLTEKEAENERRKGELWNAIFVADQRVLMPWIHSERGLAPLPDLKKLSSKQLEDATSSKTASKPKAQTPSLSFSSSKSGSKAITGKRKAIGDVDGDADDAKSNKGSKKKAKKAGKTLLSFGDDEL